MSEAEQTPPAVKPAQPPENFWSVVERVAKRYSNLKTLIVAVISVVGTVFAAGVYYNELTRKLNDYVTRIEVLEKQQVQTQTDIAALQNGLLKASSKATEDVQKVRTDTNSALEKLTKIENVQTTFKNDEPRNNGGGYAATVPPGRCNLGEVVVGIQPYKDGNGIRSIVMQCGVVPKVKLD